MKNGIKIGLVAGVLAATVGTYIWQYFDHSDFELIPKSALILPNEERHSQLAVEIHKLNTAYVNLPAENAVNNFSNNKISYSEKNAQATAVKTTKININQISHIGQSSAEVKKNQGSSSQTGVTGSIATYRTEIKLVGPLIDQNELALTLEPDLTITLPRTFTQTNNGWQVWEGVRTNSTFANGAPDPGGVGK